MRLPHIMRLTLSMLLALSVVIVLSVALDARHRKSERMPPRVLAAGDTGSCFGISNDFSGGLTDEQERGVPDAMRGAFQVGSVQLVTATELSERMKGHEKVAEETRGKRHFVAVLDYRCVDFGNGSSGMMKVIERYCVVDK